MEIQLIIVYDEWNMSLENICISLLSYKILFLLHIYRYSLYYYIGKTKKEGTWAYLTWVKKEI